MSIYVIADTHLSVSSEKPMDIFGVRWHGYTEKLKEAWERTVQNEDTVVIAGDISWAMTAEEAKEDFLFLEKLPGKKLLLKGNHDYWWATKKKIEAFFRDNGIKSISLLHNDACEVEGLMLCGSRGWFTEEKSSPEGTDFKKLINREVLRLKLSFEKADETDPEAEKICFLHFPPIFKNSVCEEIIDVLCENGVKRCFYGHIHGVYDVPQFTVYRGIEFGICSADYLQFVPYKVR